VREKLAYQAFL
jgi:hypothetical protein